MATIWFCLVALVITMYVILDGFDLGAGAIHFLVAKTTRERRLALSAIGPVWDGNEVWLLVAGGTLYFAFPPLYASAFSGFYLPLMIILWLLILRGIAIEFRNHIQSPVWTPLWDAIYSGASLLLIFFFGTALGNVVRGVPLDESSRFFTPLWTNLRPGPDPGVMDWYTLSVGITAVLALAMHGALWLNLKTGSELQARARRTARAAWLATGIWTAIITFMTFRVQPQVAANMSGTVWGWIFPLLAVGGWTGVRIYLKNGRELPAFLASCGYLMGMLSSMAFGLYPYVLPATTAAGRSLTVSNAAAPAYGLWIALIWWIPGMLLATGYFVFVYRHFAGKVPGTGGAADLPASRREGA